MQTRKRARKAKGWKEFAILIGTGLFKQTCTP